MGIDASIYGQIQAPRKTNMLEQFAQMQQIQGAQNQNRLADMAFSEKEREAGDSRIMNDAYKTALGPDGSIDRNKLFSALAQGGQGAKLPGVQKGFAESDKAGAEAEKLKYANTAAKLGLVGQIFSGAKDQGSYEQALATARANGLDVSNSPAQYDAAEIGRRLTEAQTLKEQLEQKWKAMSYSTPDANAKLSAATSTSNNAATIKNSANNAELTDDRAREFNSTKVEENRLKREQKQETADLTKSSQIASFDTMLGTLDRLSKHPGLTRSVGAVGMFPTMPGSDSANFQAELNTFQSQAFIPMVAQLKGMGALSDAEGKKLTAAVGALDPKMGEEAFRESVARITADMQAARARMSGGAQSGATGSWGDTEPTGKPVSIKNAADYANVPAGATYISPDGKMRTKR